MAKFKLESLDSPYAIIQGQAGIFFYSIANELCVKYGRNPYNHDQPLTASVNDKGELITADNYKLADIWNLDFIDEKTYRAIQRLNFQGYKVTK